MNRKLLGQKNIPVELIVKSPYQPRRNFDHTELESLAKTIKEQGQIQPIVVRQLAKNNYELIAGERRWRACQLASFAEIRADIYEMDDHTAIIWTTLENVQRKDLNPIERAEGFKRLIDEFGYFHEVVAEKIGKSRTYVTNSLRLLTLHPAVREKLEQNLLSEGHGKILAGLDEVEQIKVAEQIIQKNIAVNKLRRIIERANTVTKSKHNKDVNIQSLESHLSEYLGYPATLNVDRNGGKLVVQWCSNDELEGLLEKIGYKNIS